MKSIQILLITIVTAISAGCKREEPKEFVEAERSELSQISSRFNIKVVAIREPFKMDTHYGPVTAGVIRDTDFDHYSPIIDQEFNLYPPEYVERSKLQRIVLCRELFYNNQFVAAYPDFVNNSLYLDVGFDWAGKEYLRKVLHHEYFHMVDYRDDGQIYADPRWIELNPPKFKYGAGGWQARKDSSIAMLTEEFPGFLNRYSQAGVEEDKAEVFAYMMIDPRYMQRRCQKDPILKQKTIQMKELLAKFCPQINDEFWSRIATVERKDD